MKRILLLLLAGLATAAAQNATLTYRVLDAAGTPRERQLSISGNGVIAVQGGNLSYTRNATVVTAEGNNTLTGNNTVASGARLSIEGHADAAAPGTTITPGATESAEVTRLTFNSEATAVDFIETVTITTPDGDPIHAINDDGYYWVDDWSGYYSDGIDDVASAATALRNLINAHAADMGFPSGTTATLADDYLLDITTGSLEFNPTDITTSDAGLISVDVTQQGGPHPATADADLVRLGSGGVIFTQAGTGLLFRLSITGNASAPVLTLEGVTTP